MRRGLLDTSVAVDLDKLAPEDLPVEPLISALTLAELTAGPRAGGSDKERASRQEALQKIEAMMDALPFDAESARAYGLVYAQTLASSRKPRGARAVDLLIAATALANGLPLFTRNAADFEHLGAIGLEVHAV